MTAALKLNQKGTERIGNGDYIHTYKIEIHGWIFASAGVIAMAVALPTELSIHKTATANPAKSLRTD